MIDLIKGYYIDGQTYDYALRKRTGKTDTNGNPVTKLVGYHSSVQACIKDCYKDMCLELVSREKMTLFEALDGFQKLENDLREVIPKEFR